MGGIDTDLSYIAGALDAVKLLKVLGVITE